MHEVLNQNLFFIEEHVGLLKAANNYDVYNPRTQEMIIICREENLSLKTKFTRFSLFKNNSGFDIIVRTQEGDKLLRVKRKGGVKTQQIPIEVLDENDQLVGKIQPKTTPKGNFEVLDAEDTLQYTLNKTGDTEFTFAKGDQNLANISKKWAGASKELLTTADNYLLQVMVTVPENDPLRLVIFASVLAIDMVLYE
ncbi:MAG TPA: RNAase [Microscillaceae bacterium]|nr:RNAase [Microscillaceae bacterium]